MIDYSDTPLSAVSLDKIRARHALLEPHVLRTPVTELVSPRFAPLLGGGRIFLKLEAMQVTGTFKPRGALSVCMQIPEASKAAGITAVSAGNHAIAAAWVAARMGVSAKVVMLSTANAFRRERVAMLGAEMVMIEGGAAAFAEAERLEKDEGRYFIHHYEGPFTTLGSAGVGLEFAEQVPDLDAVVVSIGGGGLVSGVAAAITSMPPVRESWPMGGLGVIAALVIAVATILLAIRLWKRMPSGRKRNISMIAVLVGGFILFRAVFDPSVELIESINAASAGHIGGLGLPITVSWLVGGMLAAGAAWVIGKISLGLRSDYLAIATLGIAEIIIAVIKNEDWLTRGVKNINGIPRPVAYEVDLQVDPQFIGWVDWLGLDLIEASSLYVKISYAILFVIVLAIIMWMSEKALRSPWGRMMRGDP